MLLGEDARAARKGPQEQSCAATGQLERCGSLHMYEEFARRPLKLFAAWFDFSC